MDSFREASEFLELFVRDMGVGKVEYGKPVFPSGEILFSAIKWQDKIAAFVSAEEHAILKKLGDRREVYHSSRINCFGESSHSCGVCMMINVVDDSIPDFTVDASTDWVKLDSREKQWFADAEFEWNADHSVAALMLAAGIQAERLAVQPPGWSSAVLTKGREILDATPGVKQREFCRLIQMQNTPGGELYRHLTGKTQQPRNFN